MKMHSTSTVRYDGTVSGDAVSQWFARSEKNGVTTARLSRRSADSPTPNNAVVSTCCDAHDLEQEVTPHANSAMKLEPCSFPDPGQ